MLKDQYFDGLVEKFATNIYGSGKGAIRSAVVWRDLSWLLEHEAPRTLRILDAGGGFGHLAQQLAALGHHVVLSDPSAEMLAYAAKQIQAKDLQANFTLLHASIQQLHEHLPGETYDLVLCHAVLEWLADPRETLKQLYPFIAPKGYFSLLFYNRDALQYHALLMGYFDYVDRGLTVRKKQKLTPINPQDPAQVEDWLRQSGWRQLRKSGVRVLHDYMQHGKDAVTPSLDELLRMELVFSLKEPYASLGRYIHLILMREALDICVC